MPSRRLACIINPHSGKRSAQRILNQLQPMFATAGLELDVHVTQHAGHAREIARALPVDGCDGVCLVGGDGTVHEVVSGLMERGAAASTPLGLIPGGTGNDVVRQLGFSSPQDAARRILSGRTGDFDVLQVDTEGQVDYCTTLVGWAGVADVNSRAERLRMLGPPRYALAALWQILRARPQRARLELDDQIIDDDFLLVAACNTSYVGSGMRLAPRARVDDGLADVIVLRSATRREMFRLFSKVFQGSHVDMPCIEYYQVRALRIVTDDRRPLDMDGEIAGTPPLSIRVLPGAVRVFL